MFETIHDLIRSVNTPKFFLATHEVDWDAVAAIERACGRLPLDYVSFLHEFGQARLFRGPMMGLYQIEILRRPYVWDEAMGARAIQFGAIPGTPAVFKADAKSHRVASTVYLSVGAGHRRVGKSFGEWLLASIGRRRAKYSRRRWAEIVRGPQPFSPEEQRIVDALARYSFRKAGVAPNGDVLIEVFNGSNAILRNISVGVRAGDLVEGGVRLRVDMVGPGETRILSCDCYKDLIPADQVTLFREPPPGPEDREYRWEFSD